MKKISYSRLSSRSLKLSWVLRSWQKCLGLLRFRLTSRNHLGRLADRANKLLEALPLPFEEFALARARLGNIREYARKSEWGAAGFELKRLLSLTLALAPLLEFELPSAEQNDNVDPI